jgi:ABC-type lipoprotein export system ATPase subunit
MPSTAQQQYSFPRGAEWRRWDLHIHTPFSALNNGFGNDFTAYAKSLFSAAKREGIAAIGVTDYFTIDGYRKLREYLADDVALERDLGDELAEYAKSLLLLPNVEFRTTTIIRSPRGEDSRVNFHVIFSDLLTPDEISEHFLREIKFSALSGPARPDEQWSLTTTNLEALGRTLKASHAPFKSMSDLQVGMTNAIVDADKISAILSNRGSLFAENYIVCLPCDEDLSRVSWNGQGHLARKLLVQKSHAFFSSNPNTREFGLGKRHASVADFRKEFGPLKPCLHGSDAHKPEELFVPKEGRKLWIKADPTFKGLKQVINEPGERAFIGEEPEVLDRVRRSSVHVIDSISVRKLPTSSISERWFDCDVPLNPELVAIIGNKGSGKSALSDILGLLGNTRRHRDFSFLNEKKFRNLKNNKAKHFNATLTWKDGTPETCKSLQDDPSAQAVEKIKYIPQNYLEQICNEGTDAGSPFSQELEAVLFSHVDPSDQAGFTSLHDLLAELTEESKNVIAQLAGEIHDANERIVALLQQASPKHRQQLEAMRDEKLREMNALAEPVAVPEPATDGKNEATLKELSASEARLQTMEAELQQLLDQDALLARQAIDVQKLLAKLRSLRLATDKAIAEMEGDCQSLGLQVADIVRVQIDSSAVEVRQTGIAAERASIAQQRDATSATTIAARVAAERAKRDALKEQLGAPERRFKEYQQAHQQWRELRAALQGAEDKPGSIAAIQAQIRMLSALPNDIRSARRQRDRKVLELHREKQRLREHYRKYYGAAERALAQHPLAAHQNFRLSFNASLVARGLEDKFLSMIHKGKTGFFMGEGEGAKRLGELVAPTDFDSARSTVRTLQAIERKLCGSHDQPVATDELPLRDKVELREVLRHLFTLDYLLPVYQLQWDGKPLEQLSPGERGNLLLVFYLLVDRGQIPLVIDQPEENLDNQTVFRTLVPCIADAKKRRQIIIVTHNPNLAVVCDAEQIICASIKKEASNEVSYESGSIENPQINARIVDILEGTRPAFDKRDDKYWNEPATSWRIDA